MRRLPIRKAIIPAAGLGTRFLPATKSIPKEMIPIVDIPMIQYIVEEAVKSGIDQVVLITSRHKETIQSHFDYNLELEAHLEKRERKDLADLSRSLGELCKMITVRQKEPLGLGHAILCAASVIGDEPFAVLLPDDLIEGTKPCLKQLLEVYERENSSVLAMLEVPSEDVSKYGIIAGSELQPKLMEVKTLVEKPHPLESPSRWAICGRYVLSPTLFQYLEKLSPGKNGEIQLTDALQLLSQSERLLGYQFEGTRYDTGDPLGFIDATLSYATKKKALEGPLRQILKKYLNA